MLAGFQVVGVLVNCVQLSRGTAEGQMVRFGARARWGRRGWTLSFGWQERSYRPLTLWEKCSIGMLRPEFLEVLTKLFSVVTTP
jgi:hypothetical protein